MESAATGPNEIPLSFSQQLLRFLEHVHPGTALGREFNIGLSYDVFGALDIDALEWAAFEITRRHAALRTTFSEDMGVPRQVVVSECQPATSRLDLRSQDPRTRESSLKVFLGDSYRWSFDVRQPPFLHLSVATLAPEHHVVSFIMHHAAADAWSLGILASEVSQLYAARIAGFPSPLPELTFQYSDYAVWELERSESPSAASAMLYWIEKLDGLPSLQIRTDRQRPRLSSAQRALHEFGLPAPITKALLAIGRLEKATPFMTFLTVYALLFGRLSGSEDVLVPTLVSNRLHPESEKLIGLFLNPLLLRTTLSERMSFRDALRHVRETCLEAYNYQEVPIIRIIDTVPDVALLLSDPSYVLIPFQMVPGSFAEPELPLLNCTTTVAPPRIDPTDLQFVLPLDALITVRLTDDDSLHGDVIYSTDLWDADSMVSLADGYVALASAIVSDPEHPTGGLTLAR